MNDFQKISVREGFRKFMKFKLEDIFIIVPKTLHLYTDFFIILISLHFQKTLCMSGNIQAE